MSTANTSGSHCVEDLAQGYSNGNETFLEAYSMFSRVVNGYITLCLTAIGLVGNAALLLQVTQKKHMLSVRLRAHLAALCAWDSVLVLSCSLCYGLLSVRYGIPPFYGPAAYLLLLQPLGSFAVSGTILQLTAITVERYIAVSRPLHERVLKSRLSVKRICISIFLLSALLNLPLVAFERALVPCWLIVKENGVKTIKWSVMNVATELDSMPLYTLLCRFIPDLVFRFPVPIVLIIMLTLRTLQLSCRGLAGTLDRRRFTSNRTLMLLTLLNFKFLLCHSTYMVNTCMDMLSHPFLTKHTGHEPRTLRQFIGSLYMNDVANCLVVLHSATNWLLFIKQRKSDFRRSGSGSMFSTVNEDRSSSMVKSTEVVDLLLSYQQTSPAAFAIPFLAALCENNADMAERFSGDSPFAQRSRVVRTAAAVHSFMRDVVIDFAADQKKTGLGDVRMRCRELGAKHQRLGVDLRTSDLKVARMALLQGFAEMTHQPVAPVVAHKVVSFVLCEMRNGSLCQAVETKKQTLWRPRNLDCHQNISLLELNHDDDDSHSLNLPDELTSTNRTQISAV